MFFDHKITTTFQLDLQIVNSLPLLTYYTRYGSNNKSNIMFGYNVTSSIVLLKS